MTSTAPEVDMAALNAPLEQATGVAQEPKKGLKRGKKAASTDGLPLAKEEASEDLQPLPVDASGFRKRAKKEGHVPVRSSSIPGMTVGDIRRSLVRGRAGPGRGV